MPGLKNQDIALCLQQGGVGVLPTDTLYGLVGSAFSKKAVENIYRLRRRERNKPMIILIGRLSDLKLFKIQPDRTTRELIRRFWPGKVSFILPCPARRWAYLHRGTKTLAFRWPAKRSLRELLKHTGPLVAPSANLAGKPPAKTVTQAKRYFGQQVDFYLNGGRLDALPSTLIEIKAGRVVIRRAGAVKIH